jgi:hypothetical protein
MEGTAEQDGKIRSIDNDADERDASLDMLVTPRNSNLDFHLQFPHLISDLLFSWSFVTRSKRHTLVSQR